MKTKQKQQEKIDYTQKPTKNYDAVSKKIRKLLSATAQTFVPELAEGLKQDWFPTMPHNELQKNKGLRDAIRDKILKEWSTESIYSHSEDNVWLNITIEKSFPNWLKNPSEDLKNTARVNLIKAREARIGKTYTISERQKQKIDEIAGELPDEVIPEEEPKSTISDEEMHDLGIAPYTEKGKSIRQITGDIVGNALRLFAALVNNDTYPNSRSDILVDYIRPSREFFKGLMLELDRDKRTEIHNYLYFVITAAEDRLEIIRKINEKEDQ